LKERALEGSWAMVEHFVDSVGREWIVRELVEYDSHGVGPDGFPPVIRSALVFECGGERRVADDVPLDWRTNADALGREFARALRLPLS
jgi:hypothetical protein